MSAEMRAAVQPIVTLMLDKLSAYQSGHNAYNVDKIKTDAKLSLWVDTIDTSDVDLPQHLSIDNAADLADEFCTENDTASLVALYAQLRDLAAEVKSLVEIQHQRAMLGVTNIVTDDSDTDKMTFDELKRLFDDFNVAQKSVLSMVKMGAIDEDDLREMGVPLTVKSRKERNGTNVTKTTAISAPTMPKPRAVPSLNSKLARLVVDGVKDDRPLGDAVRAHFGNEVKYEDLRKAFKKAAELSDDGKTIPPSIEFNGKTVAFDVK